MVSGPGLIREVPIGDAHVARQGLADDELNYVAAAPVEPPPEEEEKRGA